MDRLREAVSHVADSVLYKVSPRLSDRVAMYRQYRDAVVPRCLADVPPDEDSSALLGHEGIDLHEREQVELLRSWAAHRELHQALRADSFINVLGDRTHVANRWYETPDVEIYASMISAYRPTDIVEVGSGFSTMVARRTIDWAGTATTLTAIDPKPRRAVDGVADLVVGSCVEDVDLAARPWSTLGERVLLFVDSSHVVRAGGDVPFLFNRVIPSLPPGSVVHVDDIYLPWEYPVSYRKRLYTEQYVLQALLCFSERFRTRFATHYMGRCHGALMREVFGPAVGGSTGRLGSSYWFEVTEGAAG